MLIDYNFKNFDCILSSVINNCKHFEFMLRSLINNYKRSSRLWLLFLLLKAPECIIYTSPPHTGLAADVGTLQRLPKIIGSQSLVYDLCLTCRKLPADEALSCGLVSKVLPDREATIKAAVACASLIAAKSPVAVQATKRTLIHSRDHSVAESLEFVVG